MSRAALPKSGFLFSWRQNDALVVAGNLERFGDVGCDGDDVVRLYSFHLRDESGSIQLLNASINRNLEFYEITIKLLFVKFDINYSIAGADG